MDCFLPYSKWPPYSFGGAPTLIRPPHYSRLQLLGDCCERERIEKEPDIPTLHRRTAGVTSCRKMPRRHTAERARLQNFKTELLGIGMNSFCYGSCLKQKCKYCCHSYCGCSSSGRQTCLPTLSILLTGSPPKKTREGDSLVLSPILLETVSIWPYVGLCQNYGLVWVHMINGSIKHVKGF